MLWQYFTKAFLSAFTKMSEFSQKRARNELERRGFRFDANGNIISYGSNIF
jgi:hypothetical protein